KAEAAERAMRLDEPVLGGLLGVGRVPSEHERRAEGERLVGEHELFERRRVAPARALDERLLARCLHTRIVIVQAVLLTIRSRALRRRLSTRASTTTVARTPTANQAHGNDPPDAGGGGDSGRPAATRVTLRPGPATNQPP